MDKPQEILSFWLDEVGQKGWYEVSDALDARIRERFLPLWEEAVEGAFALWLTYPTGSLAYIILLDQFSRNMFRGAGKAFCTDKLALAAAKAAIQKGWDLRIDEPARQFFYLPLMHSENLSDQDRCVRLIAERMPIGREGTLIHAQAHREVIREFGRFPTRNQALERVSSAEEAAYVSGGGYGAKLRELQDS
ncbi:MAG: DUF924 family protein [Paracoccaceae bacterium]